MTDKKNGKGGGKKGNGGKRQLFTRVKSARGRTGSSTKWLQRQLNDPYVSRAKEEGYRSRAAYKLIEIDDKFQLLKKAKRIVDLGAAPGGWTQVAVERTNGATIIGIDLQEMEPIVGATLLHQDFTEDEAITMLEAELGGKKVDVVLSDMAAAACGHTSTDHLRIVILCDLAFNFAKDHLAEGGSFVAKILQGGTEQTLFKELKRSFATVKHMKPPASRQNSSEMYVVATGFRGTKDA